MCRTEEDVLQLCGGGDWHMGYLLLYRAITVELPAGKEAPAAAAAEANKDAAAPMES